MFVIHHAARTPFYVTLDRTDTRRNGIRGDDGTSKQLTTDGKHNTNDGGRGVYFKDPNGHVLEILTKDGTKQETV